MKREERVLYWKASLRYLAVLLGVWFAVSYLAGILLADRLDAIARIGGFPLGYWFANQGSMLFFVLIIGLYVFLMARLDAKYGVRDD